ncbi:MAG: hypothetical protein LZF61_01665 [Nitrosomonas sp.]|nr:MAG: hypothetical protein LZF61_01665 [Nitrosomonas sp.]
MKDLLCFDKIIVEKPTLTRDAFHTHYILERGGKRTACCLRHKYEESIEGENAQRYANLTSGVPAINHGLYTKEIVFEFDLGPQEYRFFDEMLNKMSIEIFVSRFYHDPLFIKKHYVAKVSDVMLENASCKAKLSAGVTNDIGDFQADPGKIVVLSSGGKESLLCYGLLNEAGMDVYPIYINESGGHWRTALTAYRAFKQSDVKTKRIWSNIDHLYAFMARNSPIVERNIKGVKSITDPLHFFTFAHYVFASLPLMEKAKIGNICVGNEYIEPTKILDGRNRINDVSFFPGIYDQSQEFDRYMTDWFGRAGYNIKQWAPVRTITGFQVQKTLATAYPSLFKLQTSCHHAHSKNGRVLPCGTCQKCMRILAFCIANKLDHTAIGYGDDNVRWLAANAHKLMLAGDEELEHTFYHLSQQGFGVEGEFHSHIEKLHFDDHSSDIDNIPAEYRRKIYPLLLRNAAGVVNLSPQRRWEAIDLSET